MQIGVTLMGTLAGVLGGYLAKLFIEPLIASSGLGRWVNASVGATVIAGGGIVFVELILGELVPKALALRFTDTVALLVAPILDFMARVVALAGGDRHRDHARHAAAVPDPRRGPSRLHVA